MVQTRGPGLSGVTRPGRGHTAGGLRQQGPNPGPLRPRLCRSVSLCPPGSRLQAFTHACTHVGGGGGRPGTDPLCPVRRKGCGSCEACPPSFRLSRASLLGGASLTSWARGSPPSDRALYQHPSFQITDRDWPAPSVQGTPQRRAQSQVFGAGLRQSSPCSEALAPRGPLRGCPR